MLDYPDFKNISTDNYNWEILPTFLLAYGGYVTRSLKWEYVKVIAIIWCNLFTWKTQFHEEKKLQGIFPIYVSIPQENTVLQKKC